MTAKNTNIAKIVPLMKLPRVHSSIVLHAVAATPIRAKSKSCMFKNDPKSSRCPSITSAMIITGPIGGVEKNEPRTIATGFK